MSNTQYQRGVADLKAAGLNPMLAYGNLKPSAPQGSGGGPSGGGEDLIGSALKLKQRGKIKFEEQLLKDQAQTARSVTSLHWAQQDKTDMETRLLRLGLPGARNEAWIAEQLGGAGKAAVGAATGGIGTAKFIQSIFGRKVRSKALKKANPSSHKWDDLSAGKQKNFQSWISKDFKR